MPEVMSKAQRRFQEVMESAPEGLRVQMGMVGSMVHDMIMTAGPEHAELVQFQADMCDSLAEICREKLEDWSHAPES